VTKLFVADAIITLVGLAMTSWGVAGLICLYFEATP
jgi:hypothetical protein